MGPNHIPGGTEASLDIQYIMSLGANISTWFWSTAGLHENQEPFLDWLLAIGNTTDAPSVHSISYGDDEDSLTAEYVARVNTEFMKLGLRGLSILFASGDDGAGCTSGGVFGPNFPASSPWVTAVGGTAFPGPVNTHDEEGISFSGGGFSNVFPIPSYQAAAVASFLNTSTRLPPSKMYNSSGRAYPDISALSVDFPTVVDFVPLPVQGTSASTPVVSGIIASLNDVRLSHGLPALGFLNPWLYAVADKISGAFYDVKSGCHMGCGGDIAFCSSAGWDPVTGVGTPNFAVLSKAVLEVGFE